MKNKMSLLLVVFLLAASFDVSSVNGPFSCARRCRRITQRVAGSLALGSAGAAVVGVTVAGAGAGSPIAEAAIFSGTVVAVGLAVCGAAIGFLEPLFDPFIDPPGEEARIAVMDAHAREQYELFQRRASRGLVRRF